MSASRKWRSLASSPLMTLLVLSSALLFLAVPASAQPAAGCVDSTCGGGTCGDPDLLPIIEVDNIVQNLALVQAGSKINEFQNNVRTVLAKPTSGVDKVVDVADCQEAIDAILADGVLQEVECIDAAIYGHGHDGLIKVGEDRLTSYNNAACTGAGAPATCCTGDGTGDCEFCLDAFNAQLAGSLCSLTLFGCSVADGNKGQELLAELSLGMGGIPIKSWTGTVFAYPKLWPANPTRENKLWHEGIKKVKDIPTLSQWGVISMTLLLLTMASIAVAHRRPAVDAPDATSATVGEKSPLLVGDVFVRVLALTLGLVVAGLAALYAIEGALQVRDVTSSLLCGVLVAYMAHLSVVARRR